ncbi:MAG: T9SS type A sorting domain-containing protein, partial [bacterium]|nr:T9SS type A sorting domain-containing protein [bacterium]
ISNGGGGLRAYSYDGDTLLSKAVAAISNSLSESVTAAFDNTVFLADFYNGVFVYEYNDDAFIYKTHINGRGAGDIAVTPDSIVFVAFGSNGLKAYKYKDTVLTEIATIINGGQAWGVEIGPDGTLFLANGSDGLRAYTFDGAAFTNTAHIDEGGFSAYDVALSSEGTAYVAYGSNGLCAYDYNGSSFTRSGKIDNGGSAHDVFIDKEGIIFCANEDDGLRAYVHNVSSFTNVGHIPDIFAYGVCAGEDNTVYLASISGGLYVYQYSGTIESKNILLPREYQLYQNYPNPFNPVTTIGYDIKEDARVRLNIYCVSGRLIETLADEHHQAGHYKVKWDASRYSSGIYIYRLEYADKHISRKMLLLK